MSAVSSLAISLLLYSNANSLPHPAPTVKFNEVSDTDASQLNGRVHAFVSQIYESLELTFFVKFLIIFSVWILFMCLIVCAAVVVVVVRLGLTMQPRFALNS